MGPGPGAEPETDPAADHTVDRPVDPLAEQSPASGQGQSAEGTAASGIDLARAALAAAKAQARRQSGLNRAKANARRDAVSKRSGSGPDDRDPQPLGSSIDRLVTERGWETPTAVGGVFGRWADLVGPELAAHCTPEQFDDGEVVVRADSTAWATQVRLLAPDILRRLNQELGDGTVRRIKVVGPSGPSWRKGRLRAPGGRGPRDTYG